MCPSGGAGLLPLSDSVLLGREGTSSCPRGRLSDLTSPHTQGPWTRACGLHPLPEAGAGLATQWASPGPRALHVSPGNLSRHVCDLTRLVSTWTALGFELGQELYHLSPPTSSFL